MSNTNILSKQEITISDAMQHVEPVLRSKLVPMLWGDPGIGKSYFYKMIADHFNLELIDIRLLTYDPTDLNGLPGLSADGTRRQFKLPEEFPIDGVDAVPAGKSGWLIVFDELPNANPSLQAAAYKIILDRKIGDQPLHKKALCAAAGNLLTNRTGTFRMNEALKSRLIHFIVKSSTPNAISHAEDAEWDHRVLSYMRFSGNVNNFNPDNDDYTYTCERTLDMLQKMIKPMKQVGWDQLPLVAGTVGLGTATEFIGFCEVYKDLPDLNNIRKNPETAPIPDDKSALFALTGTIAKHLDEDNITDYIKYIERMGIDFQIITLKNTYKNNPKLHEHPAINKWALKNAKRLA
jgi:hypothetical protein